MRLLEDELNDNEQTPYREGNSYICRGCARQMCKRKALCGWCRRLRATKARFDRQRHEPYDWDGDDPNDED